MQKAKNHKATAPETTNAINENLAEQNNPAKQHIPATMESIFGSVSWLMLQSPAHRYMFISDYEWLVMPALQARQFKIVRQDNVPIAYVSWAFISEDAENRIKGGAPKLAPHEWSNGDRLWVIDVIAPFGGGLQVLQKLQETDFAGKDVNLLRPRKDGKGMEAALLADVLKEAAQAQENKNSQ